MSFEFRNGRAAVVGRSASTAPFPSEILTGHLCDDSVGRVLLDPPHSLPPCREGTRFSRGLRERERGRGLDSLEAVIRGGKSIQSFPRMLER